MMLKELKKIRYNEATAQMLTDYIDVMNAEGKEVTDLDLASRIPTEMVNFEITDDPDAVTVLDTSGDYFQEIETYEGRFYVMVLIEKKKNENIIDVDALKQAMTSKNHRSGKKQEFQDISTDELVAGLRGLFPDMAEEATDVKREGSRLISFTYGEQTLRFMWYDDTNWTLGTRVFRYNPKQQFHKSGNTKKPTNMGKLVP